MKSNKLWILALAVLAFLLTQIKPYIFIAIIPGLSYLISKKHFPRIKTMYLYAIQGLVYTAFIFLFIKTLAYSIIAKQNDFIDLANSTSAKSYIGTPKFESTLDLILYSPQAIINTLLRPFLWEVNNMSSAYFAIENTLLLAFTILAFILRKKISGINKGIFYFGVSTTFILALIIGWSTPVWGAIVRYKVLLLPFYFALLLSFVDIQKIPFLSQYEKPPNP